MSQNLISLSLSDEQLATLDVAISTLETQLVGLISLEPDERRSLARMGQKSEVFCRQTLSVMDQNRQIVPPSLDLTGAQQDLLALDRLRPRLDRLQRLVERGNDTETALGADAMQVALEGYALIKVSGGNQGLEGLRRELGSRFKARRSLDPVSA